MLPALFYPGKTDVRTRALGLLDRVGLSDRANAYPGDVIQRGDETGCHRKSPLQWPALLIADEPTGDLDVDTEYGYHGGCSVRLNVEGMTIVMVTHNPDLVRYATRIYGMEKGRLAGIPFGPHRPWTYGTAAVKGIRSE